MSSRKPFVCGMFVLTNYIQSVLLSLSLLWSFDGKCNELVGINVAKKITAEIIFHILFACMAKNGMILSHWIKNNSSLIRFYHIIKCSFDFFRSLFALHICCTRAKAVQILLESELKISFQESPRNRFNFQFDICIHRFMHTHQKIHQTSNIFSI